MHGVAGKNPIRRVFGLPLVGVGRPRHPRVRRASVALLDHVAQLVREEMTALGFGRAVLARREHQVFPDGISASLEIARGWIVGMYADPAEVGTEAGLEQVPGLLVQRLL